MLQCSDASASSATVYSDWKRMRKNTLSSTQHSKPSSLMLMVGRLGVLEPIMLFAPEQNFTGCSVKCVRDPQLERWTCESCGVTTPKLAQVVKHVRAVHSDSLNGAVGDATTGILEHGSATASTSACSLTPPETFLRRVSCIVDIRLKVIICMHCNEVWDPEELADHLDSLHISVPDLRRNLGTVVEHYRIVSRAHSIETPSPDGEPVFGINVYNGFRCRSMDCMFATREQSTLIEHTDGVHGECLGEVDIKELSCFVQRLSHKLPYFVVKECGQHTSIGLFAAFATQYKLDAKVLQPIQLPPHENSVPPLLRFTNWVSVMGVRRHSLLDRGSIKDFCHLKCPPDRKCDQALLSAVRDYLTQGNIQFQNVDPMVKDIMQAHHL